MEIHVLRAGSDTVGLSDTGYGLPSLAFLKSRWRRHESGEILSPLAKDILIQVISLAQPMAER